MRSMHTKDVLPTPKPNSTKRNVASPSLSVRARENEQVTLLDSTVSSSKMHLVVVVASILCLGHIYCSARSEQFMQVHTDFQFKNLEIVRALRVKSQSQCALVCLEMGSACGSFSIDALKTCRLSVLRLTKSVKSPELVFNSSNGTKIFGKMSDVSMPSDEIAVLEAQEFSYIACKTPTSWYDARESCPLFGEGFYLASITSAEEQSLLNSWLSLWSFYVAHISGNSEHHEGCWLWANPVINKLEEGYTGWGPGEPDNGMQRCLLLVLDYGWIGIECASEYGYLCKRSVHDPYTTQPDLGEVHNSSLC